MSQRDLFSQEYLNQGQIPQQQQYTPQNYMNDPKDISHSIPQNYMNEPSKITQQQHSPQIYMNNPIKTPQQFYPQSLNDNQEIYQNYMDASKNCSQNIPQNYMNDLQESHQNYNNPQNYMDNPKETAQYLEEYNNCKYNNPQYNNPQEMQKSNSIEEQVNYYKNQNDSSQRVSYNLPQNSIQNPNQNLREQYIQTPSNINNFNIIRKQTPNQRPLTQQNAMKVNNNNIPPQYPPQSYLRYKDYIKDKESREEKLELQEYLEERRLEKAMDEEEKRKKNEYKIPIPNTPQNIKSNFHMTQNNF